MKSLSLKIAETEEGKRERKEKKTFLRLLDEVKTGKMLVWISFCFIFFTTPHTIDQFLYVVYPGGTLLKSMQYNVTKCNFRVIQHISLFKSLMELRTCNKL